MTPPLPVSFQRSMTRTTVSGETSSPIVAPRSMGFRGLNRSHSKNVRAPWCPYSISKGQVNWAFRSVKYVMIGLEAAMTGQELRQVVTSYPRIVVFFCLVSGLQDWSTKRERATVCMWSSKIAQLPSSGCGLQASRWPLGVLLPFHSLNHD